MLYVVKAGMAPLAAAWMAMLYLVKVGREASEVGMPRLRVRPAWRVIPALAAVCAIALTGALGAWQSGRALEKDAVESRQARQGAVAEVEVSGAILDAAGLDGAHVVVHGEFVPERTVFWDNRFAGRVAGMAVVTPLRIAGSPTLVLVDRGVVVPGAQRSVLPVVSTPVGRVEIRGRATLAPRHTLELKDNADAGALWQNLTPEKFAARTGLPVQGFILRQAGEGRSAEGLLRGPDLPAAVIGMTAAKHRGYAFQWYALCALVAGLLIFFTFFEYGKQPGNT